MTHDLDMDCIAEGVETDAQLDFLRGRGCDKVQGYLTGSPMPAGAIRDQLGKSEPTPSRMGP